MYKQKAKKKQNKKLKGSRGITLIALVIIIIVLLILAAVSIATLTGDNGILNQAKKASKETNEAQYEEQRQLTIAEATMNLDNVEYEDKNGDKAIIPAGFAVSQNEGENTIADGLVIIDGSGNEFVWIPCDENTYAKAGEYSSKSGENSKGWIEHAYNTNNGSKIRELRKNRLGKSKNPN